jgi:N-acetylglucosaminyldiphosphoundecaprenol N-acetyl-beta-D-mannosaminyltransferase
MSGSPVSKRIRIGSIWIDAVTFAETLDRIQALVEAGLGGMVFTPNIDHVVIAENDPEFRAAYAAADLSLVDGQPLMWAARLLDTPLPEKVSGSDLIVPLIERAGQRGWRVYILGAGPGVAEEAAEILRGRYKVNVVGTASPMIGRQPDPTADAKIVATIAAAKTQLLLLALGAPKQELWLHRNRAALSTAVGVGVGASVDFVAGRVQRAPRWVSRSGLEWLYRLVREPRRLWRRYLVNDPQFGAILLRSLRQPRDERVRG